MTKRLFLPFICLLAGLLSACTDDEQFTTSASARLLFSADTVRLDTIFSGVPSAAKSLWAFNQASDGVRIKSVSQQNGAASGFRVNVDGIYLSPASNYTATDLEVRHRDSLRVFIELTAPTQDATEPQLTEDELVFTLESGVEQKVNLRAFAWDAVELRDLHVDDDYTLDGGGRPVLVRGGISVDSVATLTIAPGQTIYFDQTAGIHVYGTLKAMGTPTAPIVMRGSRLDHMFDYLPYDRVPGQWQGILLYGSSYDNELSYTDIHSTYSGVVADSSDVAREKLHLFASTIHNCQGYGLWATNCNVRLENSQLSNVLNDCLRLDGGVATVNGTTLAQFYPFDGNRGVALRFNVGQGLNFDMKNSLVTGYADDQMMGDPGTDSTLTFSYHFANTVLRTPAVTTADSVYFNDVVFEDIEDTTSTGIKHFLNIDTDNLIYDFRLSEKSAAIGVASPQTSLPTDRDGNARVTEKPAAGAYERIKSEE